ncbi:MAG: ATP synthase F1 subunit delta [Bacteroidota bacterium]
MYLVATTYAESLLQLATAQEILLRIYTDMQGVARVFSSSPELLAALKRPTIQSNKKNALLQSLFRDKVHSLTSKFLALVVHKQRVTLLPAITQAFLSKYNERKGIQLAQVATPTTLSDATVQQLQNLVQQIAPCQEVALKQRVDPALIGGYVLQIGDKQLDQSLRKKLKELRKRCVTEGY